MVVAPSRCSSRRCRNGQPGPGTTEAATSSAAMLTAARLERVAYFDVRQSSVVRAQTQAGRQRPQYALSDHARRSASVPLESLTRIRGSWAPGIHRAGFAARLEAVREGRVEPVPSVEATRLPRNGQGWHRQLDCNAPRAPSPYPGTGSQPPSVRRPGRMARPRLTSLSRSTEDSVQKYRWHREGTGDVGNQVR